MTSGANRSCSYLARMESRSALSHARWVRTRSIFMAVVGEIPAILGYFWIPIRSATGGFEGLRFFWTDQKGQCLHAVDTLKDFWFDWQHYHPDSSIYRH